MADPTKNIDFKEKMVLQDDDALLGMKLDNATGKPTGAGHFKYSEFKDWVKRFFSPYKEEASLSATKAKDWASKETGAVEGDLLSSKQYAKNAQASASTATTKASEASTSASKAKTSETNAKASETECARLVGTIDTARIDRIESNLNKEITDRGTAIANESTARANADTALGNRITDETNVRISEDRKLQNQINERRLPAGSFIWYTGKTAPTGYLVCNGQAVSRTKYSALFSAIDTIYGAGDGSTTFNLPNMMDGNGRFIRATATPSNTKQDDAIRNITGSRTISSMIDPNYYEAEGYSGCLATTSYWENATNAYTVGPLNKKKSGSRLSFDANNSSGSMKDHANEIEIRPYNIALLPLISY